MVTISVVFFDGVLVGGDLDVNVLSDGNQSVEEISTVLIVSPVGSGLSLLVVSGDCDLSKVGEISEVSVGDIGGLGISVGVNSVCSNEESSSN